MPRKTIFICLLILVIIVYNSNGNSQIHQVDGEFIREWLLLGPFFPGDLETDFLANSIKGINYHPQKGDTVLTQQGDILTWKSYRTKGSSIVDLSDAFGTHHNATIYAFCILNKEVPGEVSFEFKHDDGAVVWINNQQVFSSLTAKALSNSEDVFDTRLEAGDNTCLLKITQKSGPWGFALRDIPEKSDSTAVLPKIMIWAGGIEYNISLWRHWKYHPGDSLAWSDPDFDDRSWETFDTWLSQNRLPESGWDGIGWFRMHLEVDSTLWNTPLALTVAFQAGASEIFLDGKMIYQFGTVATTETEEKTYMEQNPKVISFGPGANHLLAVRYSNYSAEHFKKWDLPIGFRLNIGNLNQSVETRTDYVRKATIFQMIWSIAPAFLALQFLMLFLFYPRFKENLYFSIFTGGIAIMAFFYVQTNFFTSLQQTGFSTRMLGLGLNVMAVFGVRCLYSLFYTKLPKQFFILLAAGLGVAVYYWVYPPFEIPVYLFIFILIGFTEMIRVIVIAMLKKRPGIWILGLGFLIFILSLGYIMAVLALGGSNSFTDELLFTGIFGLLIFMSIYLARNFAQTNDENTRKTKELEEARKLQLSMLPKTIPSLPNLDIAVYMQTATEVGGDYYDFKLHDDGTLTTAIGDATGHGLQAGTMVSATKSMFNTVADEPEPAQILKKGTKALKGMGLQKMLMSLTIAKFKDHQMQIAAAGMPFALWYRAANGNVEEIVLKGMPLGSFVDFPYQEKKFNLNTGDSILFMSDGYPEMFNKKDEMLGEEQTKQLFEEIAQEPPERVIDHLVDAGKKWANGRAQEDDVTFVVMKIK